MHAGRLRDQVTFQTATQSEGAGGQPLVSWADYRTLWANVHPKGMKEKETSGKPEAQTEWIVETRYDSGLNQQMRVVFGSHTFQIVGFTWDKYKRWMFFTCLEAA